MHKIRPHDLMASTTDSSMFKRTYRYYIAHFRTLNPFCKPHRCENVSRKQRSWKKHRARQYKWVVK